MSDANHFLWEKHRLLAESGLVGWVFFFQKSKIIILELYKPLFYCKFLFKNYLKMQLYPESNTILGLPF